jgi:hypothetical protein
VFLSFVKRSLSDAASMKKMESRESSALCILACATALEAKVNDMLSRDGRLPAYDELRMKSKMETCAHWADSEIKWSERPWSEVGRLLRIRNWLVHYKEAELGLVNTRMEWIRDGHHKPPKIDPVAELTMKRIGEFYKTTREAMVLLSKWMNLDEFEYSYLEREDYCAFNLD